MRRYTLEMDGQKFVVDVQELTADRYQVRADGQEFEVRLTGDEDLAASPIRPDMASPRGGGNGALAAPAVGPTGPATPAAPRRTAPVAEAADALTAPMPGKILSVEVDRGARIARGQTLVVLEAMKMKNAIKAPRDGVVTEVVVRPEQSVAFGDLLLRLGDE